MARRSSRPGPAEVPKSAPKRRASARLSAPQGEIKRIKSNSALTDSVKSTSKKSKYFEPESSAEPELNSSDSDGGDSGSAYEEKESEDSPTPEVELEASESEEEPRGKGKQQRSGASASSLKGKELWREGVRTGLGPGKEVFIAKPQARDAGDVPYEDETLHPNTKLFLQDIAENNDRQWLKGGLHPPRG